MLKGSRVRQAGVSSPGFVVVLFLLLLFVLARGREQKTFLRCLTSIALLNGIAAFALHTTFFLNSRIGPET